MLHALIMAGGTGTRFWPESRAARPKQLLALVEDRSLLAATAARLEGLVPPERVMVVTGAALMPQVAAQLPGLPPEALIGEPCKRDTAACIALAAALLVRRDPEAVMAVLPSDHLIDPAAAFRDSLSLAERLVASNPQLLVTFGIRPSYPAESFGYIERGEPVEVASRTDAPAVFRVARFHEKPKVDIAASYLESGRFYWNAGIFVWRAATILSRLAHREPELHVRVERIADAFGTPDFAAVLDREFSAIRAVSIDYAVMETAENVVVIEAPFEWDDVGSWQALARLRGTDEHGNTIVGKHVAMNTTGTIVRTTGEHLVVTLGLRDCLIVHTPDATLVANKHDEEAIRELVRRMEEAGLREYL